MRPATTIDLFCGVGGMTHGFVKENLHVVAGFDNDSSCKYAYEKNNSGVKFLERDVQQLSAKELMDLYPEGHIKILVGCAPCTPFSRYTIKKSRDDKWKLLYSFARLVKAVQPDIV